MQPANLIPRHGAEAFFGHSAELLVPFAASRKMIVEHPQHERPIDILERLTKFVEVSQEIALDSPATTHAQQLEQVEHFSWIDLHGSGGQKQQSPRLVAQARAVFGAAQQLQ